MKSPSTILFLEVECLANDHPVTRPNRVSHADPFRAALDGAVASSGEVLAKIIAPYIDNVEIVITDWTAIHAPLDDFRRRLPESAASRVIGSIYLEELTDSSWSDYHSSLATRFACIQLWINHHRPALTQDWLALDLGRQLDDWPENKMEHLVCGFLSNQSVQHQLAQKLGVRNGP